MVRKTQWGPPGPWGGGSSSQPVGGGEAVGVNTALGSEACDRDVLFAKVCLECQQLMIRFCLNPVQSFYCCFAGWLTNDRSQAHNSHEGIQRFKSFIVTGTSTSTVNRFVASCDLTHNNEKQCKAITE